jgi:hypothetical protein
MFIVRLHMTHEALSLFPHDTDYNMFTNICMIPFHYSTSFIHNHIPPFSYFPFSSTNQQVDHTYTTIIRNKHRLPNIIREANIMV